LLHRDRGEEGEREGWAGGKEREEAGRDDKGGGETSEGEEQREKDMRERSERKII